MPITVQDLDADPCAQNSIVPPDVLLLNPISPASTANDCVATAPYIVENADGQVNAIVPVVDVVVDVVTQHIFKPPTNTIYPLVSKLYAV